MAYQLKYFKRSVIFVLFLLVNHSLFAQTTAKVTGKITSHTTAGPVAYADVGLKPGRYHTITNNDGEFEIPGVKPGLYELRVKSVGFHTYGQNIEVKEESVLIFNITLKEDIQSIEGVEVIGKSNRQDPYLRDVFSSGEIQRIPARDVGEYLREEPNLAGVRKGATNIDPVLRGMKAGQLNVQLNSGQKIEGGCPNRMDPASSHIDPNDLSSIEILKGPYALRYGPVFGGVINLNSSLPRPTGHFTIGMKAMKGWESNWNGDDGHLSIYGGNRKVYFNLSGNRREYGNYEAGNREKVKSSFQKYNFTGEVGYSLVKHHSLSLYFKSSHGFDIHFPALPMDERMDNTRLASLKYNYSNSIKRLQSVDLKVYRSDVYHEMDNKWRPFSDTVVAISKVDALNQGGRIDFGMQHGTDKFHFGMDYENIFKDGRRIKNFILQPGLPVKTEALWENANIQNLGFFAEYRFMQSANLQWIFAGRLDFNQGTSDALTFYDMKGNTVYFNDTVDSDFVNLSFSAGLRLRVNQDINIDFSLGRGVRSPDMVERFIILLPIGYDNYDYLGNPQLKPENNHQADLTLRFSDGKFGQITANGFFSYITDFISGNRIPPSLVMPQTSGVLGVKQFVNIDYALLYGFEFQWKSPSMYKWESVVTMAYTTGINPEATRYTVENGNVVGSEMVENDPLPELPPLEGNLKLRYNFFGKRLVPEVRVRAVSAQNRISASYDEDSTPGFVVFGLNLYYQYNRQISVSAGINNLLDTFYYEHLNRRMIGSTKSLYEPGRIAYLKILLDL